MIVAIRLAKARPSPWSRDSVHAYDEQGPV